MELYHVLNRGVEGRNLFNDGHDYARFVHDLYEFNDARPTNNSVYRFNIKGLRNPYFYEEIGDQRERIVDVHGWCLMKNHYHLLLSERVEGGLTLFMRKLNIGYANYFNERNARAGSLFQGRTKKILVGSEAHFLYILHYIHLNPLDYLKGAEKWRIRSKNGIGNMREALSYLETYRWSSYLDYLGQKNFPSIITTGLFKESLGNYRKSIGEYLQDAESDFSPKMGLE